MAGHRFYKPLLAADWDSASSDPWVANPPKVQSTSALGSVLTVDLLQSDSDFHGIPAIPQSPETLDFYQDNASGDRKPTTYSVEFGFVNPTADFCRYWYFLHTAKPPWLRESQASNTVSLGEMGSFDLTDYNGADGFLMQARIPLHWRGMDVAKLLFAFARFYSAGAATAKDYLDREAAFNYSIGVWSYLRRRRIQTHRVAGESLMQHLKRLTGQAGAMLRYGGYQDGDDTVQQLGLGVLDWDVLRELSTVIDGDYGESTFLTAAPTVRWTDQFILNRVVSSWGYGWVDNGTPEYPVALREQVVAPYLDTFMEGPANQHIDVDTASEDAKGSRSLERQQTEIQDLESADNIMPSRWLGLRRDISIPMGPAHWDFDVGDIIHLAAARHGMDGTERLLVTSKTINWTTLHALVQVLQIDEPAAIDPTAANLNDFCTLWLHAQTGITTSGSEVTDWADQSGNGNDADLRAPATGPLLSTVGNGLAGYQIPDFNQAGVVGMKVSGTLASEVYGGTTIIAVVRIDGSDPATGWVFSADRDFGDAWAVGVRNLGSDPELGLEYQNTSWWSSTDVDQAPLMDEWHILTFVWQSNNFLEGQAAIDIMAGTDARGLPKTDPGPTGDQDHQAYGIGYSHYDDAESLEGRIAEIQVYNAVLRPHQIRQLHQGIRERWPGEGL